MERSHTLATSARRLDDLRGRELLAMPGLTAEEALELLALSEALARKAVYGRQLTVRSARSAGASWADIGRALGTTKQSAWEAHQRWLEDAEADLRAAGLDGPPSADA